MPPSSSSSSSDVSSLSKQLSQILHRIQKLHQKRQKKQQQKKQSTIILPSPPDEASSSLGRILGLTFTKLIHQLVVVSSSYHDDDTIGQKAKVDDIISTLHSSSSSSSSSNRSFYGLIDSFFSNVSSSVISLTTTTSKKMPHNNSTRSSDDSSHFSLTVLRGFQRWILYLDDHIDNDDDNNTIMMASCCLFHFSHCYHAILKKHDSHPKEEMILLPSHLYTTITSFTIRQLLCRNLLTNANSNNNNNDDDDDDENDVVMISSQITLMRLIIGDPRSQNENVVRSCLISWSSGSSSSSSSLSSWRRLMIRARFIHCYMILHRFDVSSSSSSSSQNMAWDAIHSLMRDYNTTTRNTSMEEDFDVEQSSFCRYLLSNILPHFTHGYLTSSHVILHQLQPTATALHLPLMIEFRLAVGLLSTPHLTTDGCDMLRLFNNSDDNGVGVTTILGCIFSASGDGSLRSVAHNLLSHQQSPPKTTTSPTETLQQDILSMALSPTLTVADALTLTHSTICSQSPTIIGQSFQLFHLSHLLLSSLSRPSSSPHDQRAILSLVERRLQLNPSLSIRFLPIIIYYLNTLLRLQNHSELLLLLPTMKLLASVPSPDASRNCWSLLHSSSSSSSSSSIPQSLLIRLYPTFFSLSSSYTNRISSQLTSYLKSSSKECRLATAASLYDMCRHLKEGEGGDDDTIVSIVSLIQQLLQSDSSEVVFYGLGGLHELCTGGMLDFEVMIKVLRKRLVVKIEEEGGDVYGGDEVDMWSGEVIWKEWDGVIVEGLVVLLGDGMTIVADSDSDESEDDEEGLSPQARWAVDMLMEFVALLSQDNDEETKDEDKSYSRQRKTKRWSDDDTARHRITDKIFNSLSKYSLDDLGVEITLDDNETDDDAPSSKYHLLQQTLTHHLLHSPLCEGATLLIHSLLKKEDDIIGSATLWKKQSQSTSNRRQTTTPSSLMLFTTPPSPDALTALPLPSLLPSTPATAPSRLLSPDDDDPLPELLIDYRLSSNSRRPLLSISQIYALSMGIHSNLNSQSSPAAVLNTLQDCRELMMTGDVISLAMGLLACHVNVTNRTFAEEVGMEVERSVTNHDFDSRLDERLALILTIICRVKTGAVDGDDGIVPRGLDSLLENDDGVICWGLGLIGHAIVTTSSSSSRSKPILSKITLRLLSLLQSCLPSSCHSHILTLQSVVSSMFKGEELSDAAATACHPSTNVTCLSNRRDFCKSVCLGLAWILPAVLSSSTSFGKVLHDVVSNKWSDLPGWGYIQSSLFHARLARGDYDDNEDSDVLGEMEVLLERCRDTLEQSKEDDALLAMVALSSTYKSLLRQMSTSTVEMKKKMKRIDGMISKLLFSPDDDDINPFVYGAFLGHCPFLPLGDCRGSCPLTTPPRLKSAVSKKDIEQVVKRLTNVIKKEDDDDVGMMTMSSSKWREEGLLTIGLLFAMKRTTNDDGGVVGQRQQQPQDKKRIHQQQPSLPHGRDGTLLNGILSPLLSKNKNDDTIVTNSLNCLFGIPLPPPYANLLHQFIISSSSSEKLKETSLKLLTDQLTIPHRATHDIKSFISSLASTLKNHNDNSSSFNNDNVTLALCNAYAAAILKCSIHEVSSMTNDLWNIIVRGQYQGGITSFLGTLATMLKNDKKEEEMEQKRKQSSLSPAARRSLRRFLVTIVMSDLNSRVGGWGFDVDDDEKRRDAYDIGTRYAACLSFIPSSVIIEESTKERMGGSLFDISNGDDHSMIISRATILLHLLDDMDYFTPNERKQYRHRVRRFLLSNDNGCSSSVRQRLSLYYARLTSRHGSDEDVRDEIRYIFDQWLGRQQQQQQQQTNDDECVMMEWLGIMIGYFWNRHVMTTTTASVDKPNNRRLQRRLQRVEIIESFSCFSSFHLSIDDDEDDEEEERQSMMTLKNVFIDAIVTSCCHDMAPKLGELCHCWDEDIEDETNKQAEKLKQQWAIATPQQQQRQEPSMGAEVTNRAYRLESTTKQASVKGVLRDVVRYCRDREGDDWSRFAFLEAEEVLEGVMNLK